MPGGELHIRHVTSADSSTSYRCSTVHKMTGEVRTSTSSGRLFVTEPPGSVPPRIYHMKLNIRSRKDSTVVLPCVAQGFPVPLYSWYKKSDDGVMVPVPVLSGRFRQEVDHLRIESVQETDTGVYVCTINNTVGIERVETNLFIWKPLSVSLQPKLQVAMLGQSVRFHCLVGGFPVLSIVWLKDGKSVVGKIGGNPVSEIDEEMTVNQDVLVIVSVKKQHRGMYQCVVFNDDDSMQASAELRLSDLLPEFRSTFTEAVLQTGSNISVRCSAFGIPLPVITWRLDDNHLTTISGSITVTESVDHHGDVVSYLNSTHLTVADGGEYSCVATNRAGFVTHSARINIYGSPFIRPIGRKSAVAGRHVIIKCLYGGYPIEAIYWEKDGTRLPVDHRQVVFRNGTLLIRDVQRSLDGGRYRCVVVGAEGRNAFKDVEVIVLVPPTVVPFAFQENQLHLGMRAQVFCAVSEGDLPLTLMWLKDDQPLTQSVDVVVRRIDDYTSSLVISAIGPRHRGNYTCVAANGVSSASHSAFLSVHVPPSWILMPSDVEVYMDSSTIVDCKVDGTPEPKIKWMKAVENSPGEYDEVAYIDEHTRQLPNGSLFMNRVREQDGGIYSCRATNGVGPGLGKVISVIVRMPVKFDIQYANETSRTGDTAVLRCQPTGDLPMEFTWFFGGRKINLESNSRFSVEEMNGVSNKPIFDLTVTDVSRRDAGVYTCQVRNAYGGDETRVRLIVLEPPLAPEGVTVVNHGSRSISLSWTRPYHNNDVISRYIIQLTDTAASRIMNVTVAGSEISTAVSGLNPATSYVLRMAAENQVGLSEFSKQVNINTAEEAPTGQPRDMRAEAYDGNSISVSWMYPSRDTWNGIIRGFHVGHRIADSSDSFSFQTVELSEEAESERFSTLIANLRQYTKYSVTVRAFNSVGYGPRSDEIIIVTSEGVPDKGPSNVSCIALTSQSLRVWWDPLPTAAINGILQGYKVLYAPSLKEEWYGGNSKMESVQVDNGHYYVISSLKKATNYTVQVVGFTQAGDGEKSGEISCLTKEDVPDAPGDIKVMTTSANSILVTWTPPIEPNGILTKYNVYMRRTEPQLNREDVSKHAIPATQSFFEANGLQFGGRYEFWVTASTTVGEGQSTRVVHQRTAGTEVPARIVSFGRKLIASWNSLLELPCQAVGVPQPSITWTYESRPLTDRSILVVGNGSLIFHKVNSQHQGSYVCRALNKLGADEVNYQLKVEVAPQPPSLYITGVMLFSLELKWIAGDDGGSPITKFDLFYKRDFSEWEQVSFAFTQFNTTLDNLECGTGYQIYITASNKHGTSSPSAIISGKTKGTAPTAPDKSSFIRVGTTSVTLYLTKWHSGDCPILYFVVQYKSKGNPDYRLVSNNVLLQFEFIIPDLSPATWHMLQVTAHNNAGSTQAHYELTTLSVNGGTVIPAQTSKDEQQDTNYVFYNDIKLVVLATSLLVLVFTVVVIVWFYCNRKIRINLHDEASSPLPATHLGRQDLGQGNNYLLENQRKDMTKFSEAMMNNFRKEPNCEEVNPYATSQIVNQQLNEMQVFVGDRNTRVSAVYPALNSEVRTLPRKRDEGGLKVQEHNYCQQEFTMPIDDLSPEVQQRVITTCYPVYASFPRITSRCDPRQGRFI
ncbi:Down syndrome cell adhesion molecule-like protein 1 [Chamberlinius hualienensis]